MTKLGKMAGAAAAVAALLLIAPSSEAQAKKRSAQATKIAAVTKASPTEAIKKPHRLILQVNSNEPAMINNTRENMSRAESKEIPLISEAKVVKSGVVRVMELQEQGWTYVKP
jgi:intracellular sulfur oxidation DsrE/DsrF family protein